VIHSGGKTAIASAGFRSLPNRAATVLNEVPKDLIVEPDHTSSTRNTR
jgi:hypothetical protein